MSGAPTNSFVPFGFGPRDPAVERQQWANDLYRFLKDFDHARTCFPTYLKQAIKDRVWEFDRIGPAGHTIPPASFYHFIPDPYAEGLGANYELVEALIAGRPDMVEVWEKETGRKVGGGK